VVTDASETGELMHWKPVSSLSFMGEVRHAWGQGKEEGGCDLLTRRRRRGGQNKEQGGMDKLILPVKPEGKKHRGKTLN